MSIEADMPAPTSDGRARSLMGRVSKRLSAEKAPAPGFVHLPEPRRMGSHAVGRQMTAGIYRLAGHLVQEPDTAIWDIAQPDDAFVAEMHSFIWLDDLAAFGGGPARKQAQRFIADWIDRYGDGDGPGWPADLTGRRVIRWINHAYFLMSGQSSDGNIRFIASLNQQARYLREHWQAAPEGLPTFEALTALVYAGVSLGGMADLAAPACKALGRECKREIDPGGGLRSRDPEELMEVFTLINWAADAAAATGRQVDSAHHAALGRVAANLRALRHADGGLARFHGGGRGLEGRLDQELAHGSAPLLLKEGLAMGFARLEAQGTTVIMDASAPPTGLASLNAHASTLAFELTSGRRPVIVNCGPGARFGGKWHRAGRATQSHSTLAIEGAASAQLEVTRKGEQLKNPPERVNADVTRSDVGMKVVADHDGYTALCGLTHQRRCTLSPDGRRLKGVDTLSAETRQDRQVFDRRCGMLQSDTIGFAVRFHLHPDVEPSLDMGGKAVSLTLKSGEVWVFRAGPDAKITVEPSFFLEKERLQPRSTQQIVLTSQAMEYGARVGWDLAKAKDF